MSSEIIAVLDDVCSRLGIVVDWSSENLLPYVEDLVRRLISYEAGISIVQIVVWFMIFLMFALCIKIAHSRLEKAAFDESELVAILGAAAFISLVGFVCVFIKQTIDLVACVTFPEKIIMAYLREFRIL